MTKTTKKPIKKVVKKVVKKTTKSVMKSDKKPDIWILQVQFNGSINHTKINSDHYFYEGAIKAGGYTFTQDGLIKALAESSTLFERIRKEESKPKKK